MHEEIAKIFNSNRQKCKLTWQEIYDKLNAGYCLSTIALEANISRQAIYLLFNKYFKNVFKSSLTELQKAAKIKKEQVFIETQHEKYKNLKTIKLICNSLDLDLKFVKASSKAIPKSNIVLINNKKCNLHYLEKQFTTQKSSKLYWRTQISSNILLITSYTIILLRQSENKNVAIIIPNKALKNWVGNNRLGFLYIGDNECEVYKNHYPQIDWWQYENAWHLLKNGK